MTEQEKLVVGVVSGAGSGSNLIGLGTLIACLALAFFTARGLRARVAARGPRWKFGEGGFERVAFPLVALAVVWAAKLGLHRFGLSEATPILDLANALLVAWTLIRAAVYVLRSILPDGGFLRGSERTVAWIMWVGVALYLTGLLPDLVAALDEIAFTAGKQRISLWLVIQAVVSVAIALAISMWIAGLLEGRILKAERVEASTRAVLAKLVRAVAFFVAILVALPLAGIDITALSVFSGALGVGLGFGLQKIASNYVSGFIILLDRSVRLGDLVTVDNRHGTVLEIASRYTVVKASDGTESIIPNELLITQSVTNHSYTDRKAVAKVVVLVGLDADVDEVLRVLEEAGRAHPRALAVPAPGASVTRVTDSAIEVELAVWTDDALGAQGQIRSDLLRGILKGFRRHAIRVPAPRLEISPSATPETGQMPS